MESASALSYLDQCLTDLDSLRHLRASLEKIEKCCLAARDRHNLADILFDRDNRQSLLKMFGAAGFDTAVQILLKLSLGEYTARSIVTHSEISGRQKLGFLARCLGGWKQFDAVISLQLPPTADWEPMWLLNPRNAGQWKSVQSIPSGTLCTVFFKNLAGRQGRAQELLAAERFEAVFDTVQSRKELEEAPAPSVQVTATRKHATAPIPLRRRSEPAEMTAPAMTLKVIVNKMDVVVHAGNANLIVNHLRIYHGKVMFFVLRPEKKPISLDPDSIWSAEIRNGETVLFEFYGPRPAESFVKELASCVNRYTQMDKIANE